MIKLVVAYHSGYGHTDKVAKAVADGATTGNTEVKLIQVASITEEDWSILDAADVIVFGAPTYMGGVSGPFKLFLDATSVRWMQKKWHNKFAAGFTNSGSASGDKLNSLFQFVITAMQHGMIWIGQDTPSPSKKGTDVPSGVELNRVGSYLGLMTQSNNDNPDITPPIGDIETAKLFGKRIVEFVESRL